MPAAMEFIFIRQEGKKMKRIFGICLLMMFSALASAGSAMALTAANTQIINNATLRYNDGTGLQTATATVTVNVALMPSGPTVTPGLPMSATYAGPGTTLTNTFYVTSTSNGPDTYNITTAISGSTNTSGPTATVQAGSATIALGATVTLTGSTATDIVVPADGTSNASVNGITAGSFVVINGEAAQVSSVTDNATGMSHIILGAALTGGAPSAGVVVGERKSVSVDVTAGNITTPGTSITVTKNATATSTTAPNPSGTSGTGVTDTFTSGAATLAKYVRNVTTPATGTGVYTYNSANYYSSGITAKPTETLEYILVAANGGSGPVTTAVVTDVLPTTFVTLKPNVYGAGREVTYVSDTNVVSTYSAASDTDQATYAAGTLTVHVGTGATSGAGGSIPGNNSRVLVLYQVTVNN